MHMAILTFQGFNELDSLVALGVLNRIKTPGWRVTLCGPEPTLTSMNGVVVHAQSDLAEAATADAVIVGSGIRTQGEDAARAALHDVAPVGEKEDYVERAMARVGPYLPH
jgi:putative intracellular protease/amidase